MSDQLLKDLEVRAAQLRKPDGELGLKIAELMNDGNAIMCRYTYKSLELAPEDHILEIGMGNGSFVPELLDSCDGIRYTGLDYSKLMVTEATRLNKKAVELGQVNFVHGNVGKLPFLAQSFHKVCTSNTIYFWEDAQETMNGLYRVLKEEGQLVVAIRPKEVMDALPVTQYNFNIYTEARIEELMRASGFQEVRIHTIDEPDRVIGDEHFKLQSSYISGFK